MDKKIDLKKLYNTAEVADMLRTSPQVIRNLTSQGRLIPCKQGRYCLYTEEEILKYMSNTLKPYKNVVKEQEKCIIDQDYVTNKLRERIVFD